MRRREIRWKVPKSKQKGGRGERDRRRPVNKSRFSELLSDPIPVAGREREKDVCGVVAKGRTLLPCAPVTVQTAVGPPPPPPPVPPPCSRKGKRRMAGGLEGGMGKPPRPPPFQAGPGRRPPLLLSGI